MRKRERRIRLIGVAIVCLEGGVSWGLEEKWGIELTLQERAPVWRLLEDC